MPPKQSLVPKPRNQGALQPRRPIPWDTHFVPISFDDPGDRLEDSVTPSTLCDPCEAVRSWIQTHWAVPEPPRQDKKFLLYDNCQAFRESFDSGCHLCTLIWRSFTHHMSSTQRYTPSEFEGKVYVVCKAFQDSEIRRRLQPYIDISPRRLLYADPHLPHGNELLLKEHKGEDTLI